MTANLTEQMMTIGKYKIPEELMENIPGYLSRRDQDLVSLKNFIITNDFDGVKNIGHKLRGNGSSFGFDRLSDLGDSLMKAAESKNIEELKSVVASLESEVGDIKSAVL